MTGLGLDTKAGRGGEIIRVALMEMDGPVFLREDLTTVGPRIVVFEKARAFLFDRD